MSTTRRAVVALASAAIATRLTGLRLAHAAAIDLTEIPTSFHEHAMRAAIEVGRSGLYPFGAVIVRPPSEELLARGANNSSVNPTYHGEIVCMNNYVALHGNQDWAECVLYSTAEPCPMCMAALVWAGIGGVVYGTSIATLIQKIGWRQITISASEIVAAASTFRHVALLGGILANETDAIFAERLKR
jgi:tRNA(Arg) A34 adenosine deaminase TadA